MKKVILASVVILAGVLGVSQKAFAHEHDLFQIGNQQYQITIGSVGEPLLVDEVSAVDLTVKTARGQGITGLENNLKVELAAGDKKQTFDLEAGDTPGTYAAPFIPTIATTYTYRLFGKINNTDVSLPFTCVTGAFDETAVNGSSKTLSPNVTEIKHIGAFGCPIARADISFPEKSYTNNELFTLASQANQKVSNNPSKAMVTSAIMLALAGIGIGATALSKKRQG